MLRMTGALLICLVCIWVGFSAADRLRRRRDFLECFVTSLSVLETEITFGMRGLGTIFRDMSSDDRLYGLYGSCAETLAERGIKTAWSDAVNGVCDNAALTGADAETIRALGSELGMSDVGGQKRAIERTAELLSKSADEAGERCMRLTKVYRGCGVLSGIFAVLMLM